MSAVEIFGWKSYTAVCAICIKKSLLCSCQLWGSNEFCGYAVLQNCFLDRLGCKLSTDWGRINERKWEACCLQGNGDRSLAKRTNPGSPGKAHNMDRCSVGEDLRIYEEKLSFFLKNGKDNITAAIRQNHYATLSSHTHTSSLSHTNSNTHTHFTNKTIGKNEYIV